jgi:cell division protein FtsQ
MPPVNRTRRSAQPRPRVGGGRVRRATRQGGARHAWTTKLGAWTLAQFRTAQYDARARAILAGLSVGVLVSVFVLIAGAVGLLDDMGRGVQSAAAGAARSAGLSVSQVMVQPTTGRTLSLAQSAEVEAAAGVPGEEVMFSVDPRVVRDRVITLPWVEAVTVRRLWPDRVQIVVRPRAAAAVWQDGGRLALIDAAGKLLGPASPESAKGLPLVMGAAAAAAAPDLFERLGPRRAIAERTLAVERVSGRRWTLRLRGGGQVLLPETGLDEALSDLERLQAEHRLLDRTFARLDVRSPGVLLIEPAAEAGADAGQSGARGA